MKNIKKFINFCLVFLLIFILSGCTNYSTRDDGEAFINENENVWAIYYAPTSTEINYGNKKATIVIADNKGNIKNFKEEAFDSTNFEYFDAQLFYQSESGVEAFNLDIISKNPKDLKIICGYGISGIMEKKNLYYFISNGGYKDNQFKNYNSSIILGNLHKQNITEIDGFVRGLGTDNDNIYLIVDNEENPYDLIIRKYEVSDSGEIIQNLEKTIKAKYKYSYYSPAIKYIVIDDYLYVYASIDKTNDITEYYMLKFSTETLELDSETYLFETKYNDGYEEHRNVPSSSKGIFNIGETIYIISQSGRVLTFNTDTNEFKEIFKIDDSVYKTFIYGADFNERNNDISFLYSNEDVSTYYIAVYSLEGNLKDLISFDRPVFLQGYPHAFIRIK